MPDLVNYLHIFGSQLTLLKFSTLFFGCVAVPTSASEPEHFTVWSGLSKTRPPESLKQLDSNGFLHEYTMSHTMPNVRKASSKYWSTLIDRASVFSCPNCYQFQWS